MPTKKRRDDFWYRIPGAWMGASQPIAEGNDCYVVVDCDKLLQAIEYFQRHRRSVRITETHNSPREVNGVHISYRWRADEEKAQSR